MLSSRGTVSALLGEGTQALRNAGIDMPGRDAEILMQHALGANREQVFDALPLPVRPSAAKAYRELIEKRAQGVPVAYLTGKRDFHGHTLAVDERVLIPRPETEYLVDWALSWLTRHNNSPGRVLDVGTGSGAVAVSVALESESKHFVVGSDVSREALGVAAGNAERLGASVELVQGSLLDWCRGSFDVIAVNLPYLRPDQAHPGIEHEPRIALFAGADGFDLNERLLQRATLLLRAPGRLIMELDPDQADLAMASVTEHFPDDDARIEKDLAGLDRYLVIDRC